LTRQNAQLIVWNGSTLALQTLTTWSTIGNTTIRSLAIGNYSSGANLDVITGSSFYDGVKYNAQLADWNGGTMALISTTNWFVTSDTVVNSVALANFGIGNRVVTGGSYYDNIRSIGQLGIFG
jgi:hypothetical protein